jgi:hypothetical protein
MSSRTMSIEECENGYVITHSWICEEDGKEQHYHEVANTIEEVVLLVAGWDGGYIDPKQSFYDIARHIFYKDSDTSWPSLEEFTEKNTPEDMKGDY